MELKRNILLLFLFRMNLLIVPYGIETFCSQEGKHLTGNLLIVPYGIETWTSRLNPQRCQSFNRTL